MRADTKDLRASFDRAAREYDAMRPGYPPALFEDIHALGEFERPGVALEVGCGTGKATLPFAQRGWHITGLDIGPAMLAVAAENLRDYPAVQLVQAAFEDWPLPAAPFDLVYAATAFHWVPREVAYPKAVQALRPGGAHAIFTHLHPRPYTGFAAEIQPIYRRLVPEWQDPATWPPTQQGIDNQTAYMQATGLYRLVTMRSYPWSLTLSAADYLRLLGTYSDHLLLPEKRRNALFDAIRDLIERRYGGQVERPYLTVLHFAIRGE